jgi:hypothetical protein
MKIITATMESNQPLKANNNNYDNWPKIITLSLLPFFPFVPYFEILKTNNEEVPLGSVYNNNNFYCFTCFSN